MFRNKEEKRKKWIFKYMFKRKGEKNRKLKIIEKKTSFHCTKCLNDLP